MLHLNKLRYFFISQKHNVGKPFCVSGYLFKKLLLIIIFFQGLLLTNITQAEEKNTPVTGIVSLDLCMDWMLAYFSSPIQIAAFSPIHKRYPSPLFINDSWRNRAVVHDGAIESIILTSPNKILVSQYNALVLRNRLAQLNYTVTVFNHPESLDAVEDYQRDFLVAIGLSPDKAVAKPAKRVGFSPPQTLLVLGANGIGAGLDTFEDSLITHAGWRNYLTTPGHIALDIEAIVVNPPDAVLWSAPRSPALANQFAEHAALQKVVPKSRWIKTDYWRWMCPGPWTWELIDQLANWKRPVATDNNAY